MKFNKNKLSMVGPGYLRGLIAIVLMAISLNTSAFEPQIDLTVKPPTAEDFIPKIKRALPKNLTFESVSLVDVEEMGKGGMVIYKCTIEIKAKVKESLYQMNGFKYSKYQLQESTKKGGITSLEALAIAAPSPYGRPNLRVIITPGKNTNNKSEKPISSYKEGSYTIIK